MIRGSVESKLAPSEVSTRLRAAMAAGNFEIRSDSPTMLAFRHGTYLTESVPHLPKKGTIWISPSQSGSRIDYEIGISGFPKYWMVFIGIVFCWLIFPPIFAHRALCHHPDRLMKNLLQTV
jgi:hypothetical protein